MINIAILGFGVVGSGTAKLLSENADVIEKRLGEPVNIKHILDLRDFPFSPFASKITHDYDVILKDKEVSVIAECMGGCHPAYEYAMAAFRAGKSVVTSNKEVVATCGDELLSEAKKNGVCYLFEASVGGGIPVLRTLCGDLLCANRIDAIDGILNGTTNYILTQMKNEGKDFGSALKEAQKKGYAEANPTADIEGLDTCRKICILGALATGKLFPVNEIPTTGITGVRAEDIKTAKMLRCSVKLIGSVRVDGEGKISELVRPCLVYESNQLSAIDDVFNGILVHGDFCGDVMFYGRGAGAEPTASAIVSDIINAAKNGTSAAHTPWVKAGKEDIADTSEYESQYYIALKCDDTLSAQSLFAGMKTVRAVEGEVDFILPPTKKADLDHLIKTAGEQDMEVITVMEIL